MQYQRSQDFVMLFPVAGGMSMDAETETIKEGGTRLTTICRNCRELMQLKLKAHFFSVFLLTVV